MNTSCLLLAFAFSATPAVPQAVTTDSMVVVDTSSAPDGRFLFVVDVLNGKPTIRQIKTVVSINVNGGPTPKPPDPPPLPPSDPTDFKGQVGQWVALVDDPERPRTSAGLSKAYSGFAELINNGLLTKPDVAMRSLAILEAGYLTSVGKLASWAPFTGKMSDYLKGKTVQAMSSALKVAAEVLGAQR